MFAEFQRAGAGRGIDVIEMHELARDAGVLHQLHRDVIILVAFQPRTQRAHARRIGEAHLQTRIEGLEIGDVIRQRGLHHIGAERLFRVLVETAHDPGHVDALLACVQADGARHRGLERQIAIVTGMIADRQAEIRNPHMLQLLPRPANERGRAVLQIGKAGKVGSARGEILGIFPRQNRIIRNLARRQKPCNRRIEIGHLFGRRGTRPGAQQRQRLFGLVPVRSRLHLRRMHIHRKTSLSALPDLYIQGFRRNCHYRRDLRQMRQSGSFKPRKSLKNLSASVRRLQRVPDVADQVAAVLEPHTQPHQPRRDAKCRLLRGGQALMGGGGGMGHDGFGIAQIVRDHHDHQRV